MRVLITEDRDFDELVYARGRSSAGPILVRFCGRVRSAKEATVVESYPSQVREGEKAFTVVEPGRVRISGGA